MNSVSQIYSAVYEALDACVTEGCCLASSEAQVQRALSHFRDAGAPAGEIAELERISITLSKLSVATRQSREAERIAALNRLRDVARSWMHRLPMH